MSIWDKYRRRFTERIVPDAVFQLSPEYLTAIRISRRDRTIRGRSIRPFREPLLKPAFDRPNIIAEEAILDALRRTMRELHLSKGTAALLVPEACVRVFVLTVESVPKTQKEREAFIRWRIARQMPNIPEDARIDYAISPGRGPRRIIVSMARAAVIREYESLFEKRGLRVGAVTIPTLSLAHFAAAGGALGGLLLNLEEDSLSLLAFAGPEWLLYRQKGLGPGGGPARSHETKAAQIATEIGNTVRFLEDKEKKKVEKVWVRTGILDGGPEFLAQMAAEVALPLVPVEYQAPNTWSAGEKALLAPLAGQVQ